MPDRTGDHIKLCGLIIAQHGDLLDICARPAYHEPPHVVLHRINRNKLPLKEKE